MYVSMVPCHRPALSKLPENPYPFMNNMDEITYWIYTKRAPCLMNYDKEVKKQNEVAHTSKTNAISVHSTDQDLLKRKKKKPKLSLLDGDSESTEKQLDVFQASQNEQRPILICNSDSESDLDFNIKKSSVKQKVKRTKLQKSRILQKKNKVITSTPKTTLRRSLRQAKLNNSHPDGRILNGDIKNGNYHNDTTENVTNDLDTNCHAGGDQTPKNTKVVNEKLKNFINGQLEDLSDVSGFTANYIRSTKAQSNKNPSKMRCKGPRNLVKESKHSQKDNTMVICSNKGVNTGLVDTPVLNCSTDSDQHIINLVSLKNNDKIAKVNRGTSILKFMETKSKSKESVNKKNNVKLNITFQSNNSPRYPKRHKVTHTSNSNNHDANISSDYNNSDRKENPEDKLLRTRSGRGVGLTLQHPTNSVLVLSNSTEQVSSMVSMNVASPDKEKKKKRITRQVRTRQSEKRDSIKERSGFTACFSDSDDSEPLQKKFFCA